MIIKKDLDYYWNGVFDRLGLMSLGLILGSILSLLISGAVTLIISIVLMMSALILRVRKGEII